MLFDVWSCGEMFSCHGSSHTLHYHNHCQHQQQDYNTHSNDIFVIGMLHGITLITNAAQYLNHELEWIYVCLFRSPTLQVLVSVLARASLSKTAKDRVRVRSPLGGLFGSYRAPVRGSCSQSIFTLI